MHIKGPALKAGVTLHQRSSDILAIAAPGTPRDEALSLPAYFEGCELRTILRALDGTRNISHLTELLGISHAGLDALIKTLARHDLLTLRRTPLPYQDRYNHASGKFESVHDVESLPSDPAISSFLDRCEIESSAMSCHSGVTDNGREALLKRREFRILIFGSDRIALSLVEHLCSSGFSQVALVNRKSLHHPSQRISSMETFATILRTSDVGEMKISRLKELRREFSLFADDLQISSAVNLVITTEKPSADQLQRWMNEQTPHLVIERGFGGTVKIGPLVEPGKTPCLRCIELHQLSPELMARGEAPETSSAMTALITGIITADIANYSYSSSTVFRATTAEYSLRRFTSPDLSSWQSHPACGCLWR